MTYALIIPRWHPARLNQMLGRHWRTMARLKKVDRNLVCGYCAWARLPVARGPRRVDLLITLGPGQRADDPDAYWKSLNDALVHAKMLIDDNRQYVQLGNVTFDRGEQRATTIRLTELYGTTA